MPPEKIHLNILGIKNFKSESLKDILSEIEKLNISYSSFMYKPIDNLKRKIRIEIGKRERSKFVWVEFVAYWSGYSSSQRKVSGKFYRKLDRNLASKLPKFYQHNFTDNTTNDWYIKQVDVKGKDEGSYKNQIDEFLASFPKP